MKPKPIAVLCSDLHLSLQAPACRAEKDWLEVQAGYLNQVKALASGLPVIAAGDIFDRWNAPPELIHFALEYLPDDMICVPGQHDLPNHRMEEMHRSGYGVLVKAGKIRDISGDERLVGLPGFCAYGFGWGQKLAPRPEEHNVITVYLAVVHRYIWLGEGTHYPGAPETSQFAAFKEVLKSYDAVVIGDNHKGWITNYKGIHVLNCGGFIRRKSDEIAYKPQVGLLMSDGSIEVKYLDTSKDRFHENPKEREESAFDMAAFVEGLEQLGEHGLNFREAVEHWLRKEEISKETKQIILRCLESKSE